MTKLQRGFTLIELLVVIAGIAILAAILFPVFGKAKQTAEAATCLNHTKQLGVAFTLYADDNLGAIVPTVREYAADYEGSLKYWSSFLFPYIKSYKAYICPSMPNEAQA